MVSTDTNFTGNESYGLNKAILIYTSANHNGYATVHNVQLDCNGKPSLLPGVAATKEAIENIARVLVENVRLGGFLPDNVLSMGIDSLIWWVRPQKRLVFFKNEQLGGERSAVTPHPGLIFHVSGQTWSVFSVKGHDRPTPNTHLFLAPYWNVNKAGIICTGNVKTPDHTTEESITGWTNAFFDSFFTHPNTDKLVKFKGGSTNFWQAMLDGKHDEFPEKVLIPMKYTLSALLAKNSF